MYKSAVPGQLYGGHFRGLQLAQYISCGNDEWAGTVRVGNDRYWDFVNSFYYFGVGVPVQFTYYAIYLDRAEDSLGVILLPQEEPDMRHLQ